MASTVSTGAAGPVFTPSEFAKTSSPTRRVGVKVCFSSEIDAIRSTAKVRTSL